MLFLLFNKYFLNAQEQEIIPNQKLSINGTLYAELQYDGITGQNQNRPKWIRTVLLTPSLSIPGFSALNLTLKISSLESGSRQPFNRFSLNTGWDWGKFFLGDAYPIYSKLSLNGILVRGFNFDLNPGLLRIASVIGNTKRSIDGSSGFIPSFKQMLYGFKIGFGKKNESEINLNFLKIRDDPNSIFFTSYKTPQENVVTSLNGNLKLFNNKLIFAGEIAFSALSRDVNALTISTDKIPSFFTKIFQPRISSQYDFAYYLESKMFFNGTLLKVSFKNINPSYFSLGTPYLKTDIRGFGISGNHYLLINKINLTASYEQTQDNISKLKPATTSIYSGYFRSDFRFNKLPLFNISYRFYLHKNNASITNRVLNNLMQSISTGANYLFMISEITNSVYASYSINWFRNKSFFSLPSSDYNFHYFNLTSNSRLKIPLSIFGNISYSIYNYVRIPDFADNRWTYSLGVSYSMFDGKFTSSIRFSNTNEKTNSIEQLIRQKRYGFLFKSEYRTENQNITLRVENVNYIHNNLQYESYKELLTQLIYIQQLGI